MIRSVYQVRAERHGRWWLLTVPTVPGAVSQVRNLAQASEYAREAIGYVLDVEPAAFDVEVLPVIPEQVEQDVAEARQATDALADLQNRAAAASRRAVAGLRDSGFTGADTAVVLGISPQRVSQLGR